MEDQELRFNASSTSSMNNSNVEETEKYSSIISENKYTFMSHAYFGTGGFRDGQYLIPHSRELFLKQRKELSAYRNYQKPILDSLIVPVFNEEAVRLIQDESGNEIQTDTLYSEFISDVNNNDMDMQSFVKQAVTYARLHGVCFVVMDNFSQEEMPATTHEAIDNRILPYAYIRKAFNVECYTCDKFGNLTSITFEERPIVNAEGKKECRYRIWTDSYSQMLGEKKDEVYIAVEPPIYHNLGKIPVICLYAAEKCSPEDVLVEPPFYDIARLSHQLYNKDSNIVDLERAQAFSVFYVPSDNSGDVTLGPHNVITIPLEAGTAPGFVSPDSSILTGLVENANKLKEAIFEIAQQSGVVGVEQASSGVAKAYDFYATEFQLCKTAYMATWLEQELAELFKAYTNESFEYIVEYPSEFQPGNTKTVIDTYKVVLDMNVPQSLKNALYEKITRMVLSDEDESKIDQIIADINVTKEITNGIGGVASTESTVNLIPGSTEVNAEDNAQPGNTASATE